MALSDARARTELLNYLSDVNCVLGQVGSLTSPIVEISEIPAQMSKLIEKQLELQASLTGLEKELFHAKNTISELRAANNSMKSLLEEAECRIISIVTEEQKRHDSPSREHQELVHKYDKLRSLNNGTILERDNIKLEMQKVAEEKIDFLKHIQQLETTISFLECSKNEALSAQQTEHQASEQMLDAQISYWQERYQETALSFQFVEAGLQGASAEVGCLTDKLDLEVSQKLQAMQQSEVLASGVVNLKNELEELNVALQAAQLENLEAASREIVSSKTISQLQAALDELESTKAELRSEVDTLNTRVIFIQGASHSMQEEHAQERMKLEEELCSSCLELIQLRGLGVRHQEEVNLLQASLTREQNRNTSIERQQGAEFDHLVARNNELEGGVRKLAEELTLESQNSKKLKDLTEATQSDLQGAQVQLANCGSAISKLEQELKDERCARDSLEQSASTTKDLRRDYCQKWVGRLSSLLDEISQVRESISCLAAVASHPTTMSHYHEKIVPLHTAFQKYQGHDVSIETDGGCVSEIMAIQSEVEQAKRSMKEEHDLVLTYIHHLGGQLYQQSFFTLD